MAKLINQMQIRCNYTKKKGLSWYGCWFPLWQKCVKFLWDGKKNVSQMLRWANAGLCWDAYLIESNAQQKTKPTSKCRYISLHTLLSMEWSALKHKDLLAWVVLPTAGLFDLFALSGTTFSKYNVESPCPPEMAVMSLSKGKAGAQSHHKHTTTLSPSSGVGLSRSKATLSSRQWG